MADEKLIEDSLEYHRSNKDKNWLTAGKFVSACSRPFENQRDLSLAYSPGVGYPCLEIDKDVNKLYEYTNKGNMAVVVSDSSAVLGLGKLENAGGQPVMEGKSILFKSRVFMSSMSMNSERLSKK